jgi:hypothetical protein
MHDAFELRVDAKLEAAVRDGRRRPRILSRRA